VPVYFITESDQFAKSPLSMNPAQRMVEYVELTGIIAEDRNVPIKSMLQ